jgi:hypothetical protein
MWRILLADLRYRSGLMLIGAAIVGATGITLYYAAVPGTPVMHFVVTTALFLPLLLNLISQGVEDKEERLRLYQQLPTSRIGIAVMRGLLPVVTQIAGTIVALSLSCSGLTIHNASPPGIGFVVLVTSTLLLVAQLHSLQREVSVISRNNRSLGIFALLTGAFTITVSITLLYMFFSFAVGILELRGLSPASASTNQITLISTFLSAAIALFVTNITLFCRRGLQA